MGLEISWEDLTSYLLINPSYSFSDQKIFKSLLLTEEWKGHCWLSTSGSYTPKWVGLSKEALLISAAAVNNHLKSSSKDCWIQALPNFHVGGLAVEARAYLSQASVENFREQQGNKWNALAFHHYLHQKQGTLTALVPTQLYDLVKAKLTPPASLRAALIGGGALPDFLDKQARELGWPLLLSYGSTECASQIATDPLNNKKSTPTLPLLPHWQAKEEKGHLFFKGKALFSAYASIEKGKVYFEDPKKEGWWKSGDRGEIKEDKLKILGRADNVIKICGESVEVDHLNLYLQTLCQSHAPFQSAVLIPFPDDRKGYHLYLVSTLSEIQLAPIFAHFQKSVLPFERIEKVFYIKKFPFSPLGKILKEELKQFVLDQLGSLTQ